MAYQSKHTGPTIDREIDRVAAIENIQEGTPSGDPMHFQFLAVGAIFNDTGAPIKRTSVWGETISHMPGKWYLNGLGDITTAEMRKIYALGACPFSTSVLAYGYPDGAADNAMPISSVRTNISRLGSLDENISTGGVAYGNRKIEVINFTVYPSPVSNSGDVTITGTSAFYICRRLKAILGRIRVAKLQRSTFQGCVELQFLELSGLNGALDLGDSAMLSKRSLLFIIGNSLATSPTVITLHADVYAWASTDSEVLAALSTKPNVTITSR